MIWFLQLLLILIGIISSLICGFFVSKSFYQHFVLSLPSITTTTAATTESIEENSSINYWKLNPDPSFLDTFNYLPAWGSYRPGYYFGMKSRESSLTSGIAWLDPTRQHFRHEAQQDEIKQLDWIEHDGIHYGKQILSDIQSNIQLETSFIVPTSAPSSSSSSTSSSSSSSSSFSWIQKISITRLQNFLSNDFRTFPFYNYFGSDCFRNDRNCLDLSTLNNIKLLTKGFKDDHILFTLMGQNERKEWLLFQVFVNQTDAIESFSFQTSSEKNVFQGIQQLKTELTNQYERVIRNKNELWLDEFGELKNEIVRNGKIKFTVLQLKIRQPVDIYITLVEKLSNEKFELQKQQLLHGERAFEEIKEVFNQQQQNFSEQFQRKFQQFVNHRKQPLTVDSSARSDANVRSDQIQVALSSLLGGIGYFEGTSRIEWNVDELWDTIYPPNPNDPGNNPNETVVPIHQPAIENHPQHYTQLLTATPSRTIFPRGFLWDEGFHQLVINHWNVNITIKILSDWLNAMYITDFHPQVNGNSTHKTEKKRIKLGWIPREMILGEDAQKRVPDEFITQRLNIANPPTFLLVLESLISRYFLHSEEAEDCSASNVDSLNKVCSSRRTESFIEQQANKQEILRFLYHVFSRLHYWIEWFRISQASSDATSFPSFRWRGRSYHDNKVIPNTLSSGLDDYPRAIYPVPEERHVDLLCWMIKAYKILDQIAVLLNQNYPTRFQKEILTPLLKTTDTSTSHPTLQYYEERYLAYNRSLFDHHYSSEYRGFYDFGINNESSVFLKEVLFRCHNPETKSAIDGYIPIYYLQNKIMNFCPESHPQPLYPMSDGQGGYTMRERVVAENFNYTVVPRIGYVNLFPFLLKLLPITAEKEFDEILAVMEDPQLLFTNYGLRSMATTDKFYLKRNAPGDAPYWRGPIWINMNYLALSALHYYGKQATIHQERINTLYQKLRNGLLDNILKEHQLTGYYWEQYDDQTGKGIRGHPFTGWTATVVNIFFEWY